jgi:hypothetical protein
VDQLVLHGHSRVEAAFLRHVADGAPVISGDRPAVPGDLTGRWGEQSEDEPHGGGLAGAVTADESDDLPPGNCQVNAVQHLVFAEASAHSTQLKTKHSSLRKVVRFSDT